MSRFDRYEGLGDSASDDETRDRYVPAICSPLDRENFEYYWSEELIVLYHCVIDRANENGWPLLDRLHVTDFVDFVFRNSSRRKP